MFTTFGTLLKISSIWFTSLSVTQSVSGPHGENVIKKVKSLCPECYKLLDAVLYERDGKIYMRKVCPEHGEFVDMYFGDVEMYYKFSKYNVPPRRITGANVEYSNPCPFSCGLCPLHMNQTALANIVVTNRCDLQCWYCFFYAEKAGFVYEPSIETIVNMVRTLRRQGPWTPNAVQLTGGEPLLRDDLTDLIRALKNEGLVHIQLNTNGIAIARLWIERGKDYAVRFVRELREAGTNTIYLSFDGVTPKSNPKNHWEIPFILEAFREGGMTSVVFVPTVIREQNTDELGDTIRFAAEHMEIVRGVNFQPLSLTGSVPRDQREKLRITIPDVIKLIEKQTNGQIGKDAWYPVPWTYAFSAFAEAFTGRPQITMVNNPVCGAATYVYPHIKKVNGHKVVEGFTPITEFVDVEALYDYFESKARYLRESKGLRRILRKIRVVFSILINIGKFIDYSRAPPDLELRKLLRRIIFRRNYSALGEFHYKMLFIGMMHFMDLYNYDTSRVMRCNIHYLTPDGRVIPFCAFNVLPDIYRDKIQAEFGVPIDEWARIHGEDKAGAKIKYVRNIEKLTNSEIYQRYYRHYL